MNKFILEKNIEKTIKQKRSNFLNPNDCKYIMNELHKKGQHYKVFYLFENAEKLIIYKDKPLISLFEIVTDKPITHKEVLGALFSHNLSDDVFGDIIIGNRNYIVVLNEIKKYILLHFDKIGKNKVKLIERNISSVHNYCQHFKEINITASSLRIDNIIAKLIGISRKNSLEIIKEDKVLINYNVLQNNNYIIKEMDILSIKKVGKFKIDKIITNIKREKYRIIIKKYN